MITGDWRQADLDEAEQAMLAYVEKLTLQPWEIASQDLEALREVGFSDRAIGDIAIHAALFAFFNRIVDGLGGRLDPGMAREALRLGWPLHPSTYDESELE